MLDSTLDVLRDGRSAEPLWRSRALRITALVVALAFLGFGFIPQFGGPGYESSLAAGLILPAASALAGTTDAPAEPARRLVHGPRIEAAPARRDRAGQAVKGKFTELSSL